MAKYKLDIEEENDDFLIIGICSHIKDYRITWLINQQLNLELVRSETDLVNWTSAKSKRQSYARFQYHDEQLEADYYLISNNAGNIKLLPDQKMFDFFLMIKNNNELSLPNLVKELMAIPEILTAYAIDSKQIKHKDNIIFDE